MREKKGVTLIELVIVLLQVAILALVFYVTIGQIFDTWINFQQRRTALLKGSDILERITDDIRRGAIGGGACNLGVGTTGHPRLSNSPCSDVASVFPNDYMGGAPNPLFSYFDVSRSTTTFQLQTTEVRYRNHVPIAAGNPEGVPAGTYLVREEVAVGGGGVRPLALSSEIQSIQFLYHEFLNDIHVANPTLPALNANNISFVEIRLQMRTSQNPVVLWTEVGLGGGHVTPD